MSVIQTNLRMFGFEIEPLIIPTKDNYLFTLNKKPSKQTKLSDFGIIDKPRTLGRR